MADLKNKIDFVYIFDVQDGNPNGDPDAGNLPRVDAETGMGLVTDVCLKRKVRNYVQVAKGLVDGYDIFIKEKAVLNNEIDKAHADSEVKSAKDKTAAARLSMCKNYYDIRTFGAVMSTGKKAIGAGAGNPPVVVDETADIKKAAVDIVNGCSFDNNLPCIAEKEIVAVDSIADELIANMKANGAYELKDPAIIEKMVDMVTKDRKKPQVGFVGKSAQYILDKVGIQVGPEVKVILLEAPKDHPFVQIELMMPILPLVRVPNVDEAIDFAVEVEHGNRHTAMMHSKNVDKLTKMAKDIETTIFVKNGPSYAGIGVGGMGYATFTIAGPTGEGLTSAKSFCRKRRCVVQNGGHIRNKNGEL